MSIMDDIIKENKNNPEAMKAINKILKRSQDDSDVNKKVKLHSNPKKKRRSKDDSAITEKAKKKQKELMRQELDAWAEKNKPHEGWGLTDKTYKEIRLRRKYIADGETGNWIEYLQNNGLKIIEKASIKRISDKCKNTKYYGQKEKIDKAVSWINRNKHRFKNDEELYDEYIKFLKGLPPLNFEDFCKLKNAGYGLKGGTNYEYKISKILLLEYGNIIDFLNIKSNKQHILKYPSVLKINPTFYKADTVCENAIKSLWSQIRIQPMKLNGKTLDEFDKYDVLMCVPYSKDINIKIQLKELQTPQLISHIDEPSNKDTIENNGMIYNNIIDKKCQGNCLKNILYRHGVNDKNLDTILKKIGINTMRHVSIQEFEKLFQELKINYNLFNLSSKTSSQSQGTRGKTLNIMFDGKCYHEGLPSINIPRGARVGRDHLKQKNFDLPPSMTLDGALPSLNSLAGEYNAHLDKNLCVCQWTGEGKPNHWCKLACFLTVASHIPKSKEVLNNYKLYQKFPLDFSENSNFMNEILKKRREGRPKEDQNKNPFLEKFKQADINFINENLMLGLSINPKEYLVNNDVLLRKVSPNISLPDRLKLVYSACANHFGQYSGKMVILGFKGVDGSASNHYCVLSMATSNTLRVFDPWPPPYGGFDKIVELLDGYRKLPTSSKDKKKGELIGHGFTVPSVKDTGLLFKYYVVE